MTRICTRFTHRFVLSKGAGAVVAALVVGSGVIATPARAATKTTTKKAPATTKTTKRTTRAAPTTTIRGAIPKQISNPKIVVRLADVPIVPVTDDEVILNAELAVTSARSSGDPRAVVRALSGLAYRYISVNRNEKALLPLAEAEGLLTKVQDDRLLADVLQMRGWALSNLKREAEAVAPLKRAVEIRQRLPRNDNSDAEIAGALQFLANVYRTSAQYKLAIPVYEQLVKLGQAKVKGVDTALMLESLGLTLLLDSQPANAIAPLQQAAAARRAAGGRLYADTLQMLGWALDAARRYPEAIGVLSQSLTIRDKVDRNGPGTAETLQFLANGLRETRQHRASIVVLTRLIQLAPTIANFDTAGPYEGLGLAYLLDNDPVAAIGPLREAVRIRQSKENIALADTLQLLGWSLDSSKQYRDAIEVLKRSLALRDRLDPNGRGTSETLQFLANSSRDVDPALSIQTRRRIVTLARAGTPGLDLGQTLDDLGVGLLLNKRPEQAIEPLREAVSLRRSTGGELLAGSLYSLGWALNSTDEPTAAITALTESVSIRGRTDTKGNLLLQSLQFLGYSMWSAKLAEDAVPVFEQAHTLAYRLPERLVRAQASSDVALAYMLVGRFSDGITPVQEAILAWEAEGVGPELLGGGYHNFGWALLETREYGLAVSALTRAVELREQAKSPDTGVTRELLFAARQRASGQ